MVEHPSLFLSHGAPDTAIADTAAARFMAAVGSGMPPPSAIVVVSAHFERSGVVGVTRDARPETIHDFGGFAPQLHSMAYPAPGHPELADLIVSLLQREGLAAEAVGDRGFDHGTWVPLTLIYPDADIPVVQVSVDPQGGPRHHLTLGRALAGLRGDGVLVIGSGSFSHNLQEAFAAMRAGERDMETPEWVAAFVSWMDARIVAGDADALASYRRLAPHAARNHPTDEHLMPLYAAIGAAGNGWRARKLHAGGEFGVLAMDAYAFD